MAFDLPELPYSYDALEPAIDAETMEIHHTKHHAGYTNNLNKALENHPELLNRRIENMLKDLDSIPEEVRRAVRNNGGGYYNHKLFWEIMTPAEETSPSKELQTAIDNDFGSLKELKELFSSEALTRFGSGWAWLATDANKDLEVMATPNQDSPLSNGFTPILGIDVWEHAYYLNYQNRRADYIKAWWNLINWDIVSDNFDNV